MPLLAGGGVGRGMLLHWNLHVGTITQFTGVHNRLLCFLVINWNGIPDTFTTIKNPYLQCSIQCAYFIFQSGSSL